MLKNFRPAVAMAACWLRKRGRRCPARESEVVWTFSDTPSVVDGMLDYLTSHLHIRGFPLEDMHTALTNIFGDMRVYPYEPEDKCIFIDWTGGDILMVEKGQYPAYAMGKIGEYAEDGLPQDCSLIRGMRPKYVWVAGSSLHRMDTTESPS